MNFSPDETSRVRECVGAGLTALPVRPLARAEISEMTTAIEQTEAPRVLVVDDTEPVRTMLRAMLEASQFQVTTAASVGEALHLIATEHFEVLLCDLHMPGAGDGFTVVSAMRHTHPDAVTLVLSGYPALQEAMDAIRLQADEILVKPVAAATLLALIRERLQKHEARRMTNTERVAAILERDTLATIDDWLARAERESELTRLPLSREQRTGHLPKLLQELVYRLRVPRNLGSKSVSDGAVQHGKIRHSQGYSVPMIIEESRILQVSIFQTLQNNLSTVDFSLLLKDVMTIADEVDSQLKQTIISFMEQPAESALVA
jgi:DNA-binding response OmpR family regulator